MQGLRPGARRVNVLVFIPGIGSVWFEKAYRCRADGALSPRGHFVRGQVWGYDGGWNMPDDYQGQYEPMWAPWKWVRKVEHEPDSDSA